MTHPFHPLHDRVLEVVDRRRNAGGEYVYLEVEDDEVHRLPAAWTDLVQPDPLVIVGAGRSLFRVDDLMRLVDVVTELGEDA